MREISAGGVVFHKDKVLVLKKFNGAWVLPKGKVEHGETLQEAALREVKEEANVVADIGEYIGKIQYKYYNHQHQKNSTKVVHWYVMNSESTKAKPLADEGFCCAKFVNYEKVLEKMVHIKEISIVKKAATIKGVNDGLYKSIER